MLKKLSNGLTRLFGLLVILRLMDILQSGVGYVFPSNKFSGNHIFQKNKCDNL
jgi:hypothetical protein